MRTIKKIHKAVYEPIADLVTYRVMPTDSLPMNALDPFIFLNHHGRQEYLPMNSGLPFGPHPHRGFETVTFIVEGDLTHKDSSGANSVIREGGVQWMTAGSGLIHAEVSSKEFKLQGGPLEILQLWVNLPQKHKMTEPKYTGLQEEDIPKIPVADGKVVIHPVSGEWNGTKGAFQPITDIHLSWITFQDEGSITLRVPTNQNVLCYVVNGELNINGLDAGMHHIVEFGHDHESINFTANADSIILFGYATPFNEPFMAYGPFVMNTRQEIAQAYEDYKNGLLGREDDIE